MKKSELRVAIQEMDTYQFGLKNELHNKLTKVKSYIPKKEAIDLIKQLDEPDSTDEYRKGYEQGVLNAIQTANESKLVEIPQFVADAIEKNKNKSLNIYGFIAEFAMDKRKKNWCIEVDGSLSYETLCRAWFDGYTIAPEPKMQITIKSYDKTELEIELPESESKKLIDQLKEVSNV